MIRLLLILILALLVCLGIQTWRLSEAGIANLKLKTEISATKLAAEEQARQAESKWVRKLNEVANESHARSKRIVDSFAVTVVAGDGLRQRTEAYTTQHCPDPPVAPASPAASAPSAVLTDMLGRLEAAGRELAKIADERALAGATCQQAYEALK
jgi:hypothetical protein